MKYILIMIAIFMISCNAEKNPDKIENENTDSKLSMGGGEDTIDVAFIDPNKEYADDENIEVYGVHSIKIDEKVYETIRFDQLQQNWLRTLEKPLYGINNVIMETTTSEMLGYSIHLFGDIVMEDDLTGTYKIGQKDGNYATIDMFLENQKNPGSGVTMQFVSGEIIVERNDLKGGIKLTFSGLAEFINNQNGAKLGKKEISGLIDVAETIRFQKDF